MSDLREVSQDPFANPVQKIFRWLRSDDFRGLCFCFGISSFILTIAMIFEANLGAGPIKQHGVVASSNSACSKFGSDHLKLTRNSYDAAILTSLCLLVTNPGEVSLGGGGMASMLFINSSEPTEYLDFTGRGDDNSKPIPGFMAGMLYLKRKSTRKMANFDNGFDRIPSLTYTHSKLPIIDTKLEDLILKAIDFIEKPLDLPKGVKMPFNPSASLLKSLRLLSKNPRSFYDKGDSALEKGDLWATLSNNGNNQSYHALLDYDKKIKPVNAVHLNITNGRIEAHPDSARLLFALGLIDKSPYKRSDAMYPTTVANAMHRASTVTHDFILENITAAIDQTYKEMVYDEGRIMQGMKMIASPWRNNYQSSFVSVIGDDAEMISLTLTVGTRKNGNCQNINGLIICFSSYGKPLTGDSMFPAPITFRPNCGICGRYSALSGTPDAMLNSGAELLKHSGLFYGEFSERVTIGSKGKVLVEGGMPRQFPEMFAALKMHGAVHLETMPDHRAIGFTTITAWDNDFIHGISDKRVEAAWPAFVF